MASKPSSSSAEPSAEVRQLVEETFYLYSKDNQTVSTSKIAAIFKQLGICLEDDEVESLVARMVQSGEGQVHFDNFFQVLHSKVEEVTREDECLEAFRVIDSDNDGAISRGDLFKTMRRLGEQLDEAQLNEMISAVTSKDSVDLAQFTKMVSEWSHK